MTQPFAWEFEGKPEWGFDYGGYLFTFCYTESQNNTRYKSKVTNLRKAKVVDEDAITVSRSLWLEIQEPNDGSESWQNAFRWMVRQIKYENPQLSPPITEPKNFGAVVEAQYWRATLRARFVFNGSDWVREGTLENYGWLELINPIIISEGVEK